MKHKHWLSGMDRLGYVDAAIIKKKPISELTTTQIVAHPELGMSRCHLRFETLLFAFFFVVFAHSQPSHKTREWAIYLRKG